MELNFKNNKLDGISREYYEMGSLKTLWSYKYGKKEGRTATYYEDGVLKWEAKYKHGKPEGMPKEYSEAGRIKTRESIKCKTSMRAKSDKGDTIMEDADL